VNAPAAVTESDRSPSEGGGGGPGLGVAATLLLLAAAAVSRWLAFMPPEAPLATVAWLTLVAIAAVRARSASVLLIGAFVVDLGWWLAVQWWIVDVSAVGYPMLCVYLATWGVLLAWLPRRLSGGDRTRRLPLWIVLPVVVTTLDVLRGEVVFGGYPWYEAGQGIVASGAGWIALAQTADLFGARGLSILVAVAAGAVAEAIRGRIESPERRRHLAGLPLAAALWLAAFAYGQWRLEQAEDHLPLGRFLAIQTALPIDNKIGWSPARQLEDVPAFAAATAEAVEAAGPPIDLVAWPQTLLPGFGLEPETLDTLEAGGFFPGRLFADIAFAVARRADAPLLVGSPSYLGLEAEGSRWSWEAHFNSVYLVSGDESAGGAKPPRYDKMVLTPFGETMPGISRFDGLERLLLDIGARGMSFDLDAGAEATPFEIENSRDEAVRIATPICFEATVASLCRRLVWRSGERVADLLVNVSNDGWLGDDRAARRMHLRLASLRAIENRTPMLRAVNTGFSAGIDSCGRIVAGLDGDRRRLDTAAGWVLAELPRDRRRPLFAFVGDRWAFAAVVATVGGVWWRRRRGGDSIRDRA